ncbi:VanW family protein [Nocardioides halotolerans]|uniref:VanW family protein n=1 Tax=Nocardioides halotolerans TaxID=433660 RepID=UPI00040592FE|nr:VanW family protein [Nocardioides halotolerans]
MRRWWGLGALGVLAAGGAYVVAVLVAGEDLPRGTSIAGVEVGGLSRDAAADRLRADLAESAAASLEVTVDSRSREIAPADAGLSVDVAASVAQAAGGSRWSPATLWDRFTGGESLDAVVDVDDERLDSYLAALDEEIATEPVEGAVRLTRKGAKVTEPVPGTAVDAEAARTALVAAYLSNSDVDLPTIEAAPEIDRSDVDRAVEEFAEPALSAPVTLRFGESAVTLEPRQYARALRLVPDGGRLVPQLRPKVLSQQLSGLVAGDGAAPVDAEIRLLAGKPRVIPAKPGVSFDQAEVDAAFLDLVVRPAGERELQVPAEVVEPEFTTEEAKALGIKEEISSFTTYYPYAEYRNVNIGRAAELVDGTIVGPGETFSLNGTVGERTEENGFTKGFIISNGIFAEDLGGGVSQMATTTFNAAFFGGMTDVEHKPHSFYIDRYPVGREATVAWPTVDLKWRNDTPYGVLVHARVTPGTPSEQGVVTVRLFSTEYWDITTKTGDRYAFTSPATRTLDTEDCYPNSGYGGFDIDVWRYWRRAGSDVLERTEKMHTTYIPSDTVICKPPGSLPD